MQIHPQIQIEDLVTYHPHSVAVLRRFGIRCVDCGEPLWGTLEQAARERGIEDLEPVLQALREDTEGRRQARKN